MKKILLIFIFVSFLIGSFCFAQGRELEIDYPQLGVQDVQQPTTTKAFLPAYIEYIFTWAIYIAGLLAFFALVYGGILYMTSAGNPSTMSNARDQIFAGFLGLIILLSSYLILNTIDPQLVILEKPTMDQAIGGIKIYSMLGCLESEDKPSLLISSSIPELFKETSILGRTILDWGFDGENKIESIKFLNKPDELTVYFYEGKEYTESYKCFGNDTGCETYKKHKKIEDCKIFSGTQPKSIELDYHLPGVYLYSNSTDCGKNPITGKELKDIEVKVYQGSSATLPEFNDKTKSIEFVYGEEAKYAVILHEHENFMGKAMLFDQDQGEDNCKSLSENMYDGDPTDIGVSSITIYQKPIGEPIGEGVAFYEDKNHEGCRLPRNKDKEIDEFYQNAAVPDLDKDDYKELCGNYDWNTEECKAGETCKDEMSSIEMRGNYIALLFEHSNYDGDCEVFTKRDSYFRDNRIGQCGFLGRSDCLSSFIIKSRK